MTVEGQGKRKRRPVSAVVIAFNEERCIVPCLESLSWADEIVVVDSGSTDATVDLARKYTDKVCTVSWRGFGPQKQAAVDLAAHDAVFNADCDERVTPELADEIQEILSGDGMLPGYSVPRRTFLGRKEIRHCGWYPDRTVRFFDRRNARYSDDIVHERVVVSGRVGECRHHLLHYSFSGVSDLLAKLQRYGDLSARQMHEAGRKCRLSDVLLRPPFAFFRTYVLKLGFLDGFEGLLISATTAFLAFTKYVKLREQEKTGGEAD